MADFLARLCASQRALLESNEQLIVFLRGPGAIAPDARASIEHLEEQNRGIRAFLKRFCQESDPD